MRRGTGPEHFLSQDPVSSVSGKAPLALSPLPFHPGEGCRQDYRSVPIARQFMD